jgi:plastocyanin
VTRVLVCSAALVVAALLGASGGSAGSAQEIKLFGTVGPEFTITLVDAQGNAVTRLDPGAYEIEVRDRSEFHTFHLQGPGVDERTEVEFTGDVTWRVTLRDGVYAFLCDVHPSTMRGTFTAGTPPPTTPPPTPPTNPPSSGSGAITARTRLVLTSGPAQVITLKTAAGKAVKAMRLGTYTVSVRDRGRIHNAHLVAPGYNRSTRPVTYTGTQTWRVKLAKIGTLRFLCDPHARQGMRGSARLVR